jgi:excinuclease UvrABC nuclease subunit
VPERQLRLFDPPKPLLERFGADFFRLLPSKPGVYLMMDAQGRIIYVGQSKNLRQRLASYRNARPEVSPRKLIRLIHSVERIVWEECETARLARIRENQLLRAHRPRFNRVNTYPQAYTFIGFKHSLSGIVEMMIARETNAEANWYGAFKSGVRGYVALLRLTWSALHQPISPFDLPRPLLIERPPKQFQFDLTCGKNSLSSQEFVEALDGFLSGTSSRLLELLKRNLPSSPTISTFQQSLFANDTEVLETFYRVGPERNFLGRQRNGIQTELIRQEDLDDLLVK